MFRDSNPQNIATYSHQQKHEVSRAGHESTCCESVVIGGSHDRGLFITASAISLVPALLHGLRPLCSSTTVPMAMSHDINGFTLIHEKEKKMSTKTLSSPSCRPWSGQESFLCSRFFVKIYFLLVRNNCFSLFNALSIDESLSASA